MQKPPTDEAPHDVAVYRPRIRFDLLAEIRLGLVNPNDLARAGIAFASVGMKPDTIAVDALHTVDVEWRATRNHLVPISKHKVRRPGDNFHAAL